MNVRGLGQRRGNADAVLAALAARGIDRREFLRQMGSAGVLLIGGPALLAACGGDEAEGGGTVVIDNWIEYIDTEGSGDSGLTSIEDFEKATGYTVDYREGVNSNEDWFGKYQPQLAAGQALGIDVAVLTDYMAARMIRLGYCEKLDKANIPNAGSLVEALKSPGFDPNRDYTMPWQSGFTIIGYDIEQTGRELTSIADLLDPAFAGKVGLLEGYIDTVPFFLLLEGKNPQTATVEDYIAATAAIKEAVDSGQIRQIYGNDYLDALLQGDLAVSMAWSGDIVTSQVDFPNLRVCFPQEGFMLFTDNMLVPKGAANKAGAEAWINHYYDPVQAAKLSAYAWYVSPVEGAREEVARIDESLADEPLIFPDAEILAKAYIVRDFTEEEEARVTEATSAAMGV
jgi:spermidine/putrescine transport system substrate-binding protein